jgi:quercetin dioxygenase-like cupin family protein
MLAFRRNSDEICRDKECTMDDVMIRSAASRPTKAAPGSSFTGTVLQDALATPQAPSRTSATLVTFTPGARTNWHTHKTRQVLVVTQGTGMVQVRDKPPQVLRTGDVAVVPPGIVHWHGALATHLFAHISFVETDGADNTTWMEPVDEVHYQAVAVGE